MAFSLPRRLWVPSMLFLFIAMEFGCASFDPTPLDQLSFRNRIQTQQAKGITVSVVALTAEESTALFGVPLADKDIQPVWVEVGNHSSSLYTLYLRGIDSNYYSAAEAAYKNHFVLSSEANKKMDEHFQKMHIYGVFGPGTETSGFVYTQLDEGMKEVNVILHGPNNQQEFQFFVPVPGVHVDFQQVQWKTLYPKDQVSDYGNEQDFRSVLEALPCCTTNKENTAKGDPLNLVIVGDGELLLKAFVSSGWDVTETLYGGSAWKTAKSFLFGSKYRYSPVSPLYVFGRPQDVAFQKARETVDERNHLRLWLSPMRYKGMDVWVGQISRDIGVRLTSKTWNLTTHAIDPNVDETRGYLLEDMFGVNRLQKFGYVKGVETAPPSQPRTNLTGDPYFTDGLRAVLFISDNPVSYSEIQIFQWELPSSIAEYKKDIFLPQ